jgi:3-dehydroquinate synthase
MNVRVNLGTRSYDIAIVVGDPSGIGKFARERAQSALALLVTDENVRPHAEAVGRSLAAVGFKTSQVILRPGEAQKSLATTSFLYDRLADLRADRRTLVVAVGGGVIGDVAGFVAATFARGLPLLMVPTTLLAMVDSAVGGKVGVNHPRAKNLVGAFHQPVGVWIGLETLRTLPEREYRSGLAEVVKYGVILDPDLFAFLETQADAILARDMTAVQHLVSRSCRLKAGIVEQDEHEETGARAILNYGHTFAHAFEAVGGYGNWLHGEAVAVGMICASRLAELHGLIESSLSQRQRQLLARFGLPTAPQNWSVDRLLEVMQSDKKVQNGRMRFVLPRRLGEAALFDDVPGELAQRVLRELIPADPPASLAR